MSRLIINPFGNACSLTLELSWETAEALAEYGPVVLAAIQEAVRARKVEARRKSETQTETDKACDQNRADWSALALRCEAEVVCRSDGPGRRSTILRQLASELNVTPKFLDTICRVFGREEKQRRKVEVVRLYLAGWSNKRIAQDVGLSSVTVARILGAEKDRIKAERMDVVVRGGGIR